MKNRGLRPLLSLGVASLLLQACASSPAAPEPPRHLEAIGQAAPAANLDPVLEEAAKGYDRVNRNGQLMFCKREQPVGSKLWTTRCLTEVELREQVEAAKQFREDVKTEGRRCVSGPGCQAG